MPSLFTRGPAQWDFFFPLFFFPPAAEENHPPPCCRAEGAAACTSLVEPSWGCSPQAQLSSPSWHLVPSVEGFGGVLLL